MSEPKICPSCGGEYYTEKEYCPACYEYVYPKPRSAAYPSSTNPWETSRFGHVAAFNSVVRCDEHIAQLRRETAAFEAEARRRQR